MYKRQSVWFAKGAAQAFNRDTGALISSVPAYLTSIDGVTNDGVLFSYHIGDDNFKAIDVVNERVLFTYSLGSGHGSNSVVDSNGNYYFFHYNSEEIPPSTLYALNYDGTIKWTEDVNFAGCQYITIDANDTIFAPCTKSGKLISFNPNTRTVNWNTTIGDGTTYYGNPIIGNSGVIYVAESTWEMAENLKVYAINPNGTIKWTHTETTNAEGWYMTEGGLLSDGSLFLILFGSSSYDLQVFDKDTGTVTSNWTSDLYPAPIVTDRNDHFYFTESDNSDSNSRKSYIKQNDISNTNIWRIEIPPYAYQQGSNIYTNYFGGITMDERGWIYGNLNMFVMDGSYDQVLDEQYVKKLGFAPWTLTYSLDKSDSLVAGDQINFTVTTAMQQTNLLTSENNMVQVVIDNGDKVPLYNSSSNANGDTVWTGSYTIGSAMEFGEHTFDIEAIHARIQTDVSLNFDSPLSGTNNTGHKITGSFSVTAKTPSCDDMAPTVKPLLYSAKLVGVNLITLYFADDQEQVDKYVLTYGEKSGNYIYGAGNIGGKGTRTYTVGGLSYGKTYYFKVRAGNGCATGPWSEEISARTGYGFYTFTSKPNVFDEETPLTKYTLPKPNLEEIKHKVSSYRIRVVDKKGIPIEGALVTLYSTPKESVTDEDGYAYFEDIESGEHKIVIAYEGYQEEQVIELEESEGADYTFEIDKEGSTSSKKYTVIIAVIIILLTLSLITYKKIKT